ncbi:MAG: alpha-amylase family glycosyl hydrolase [Deltaproteobacteria bacterium]|nr:alpha-amylase family glycosyl hydrolase [Deltaproteobacteria bacterium]
MTQQVRAIQLHQAPDPGTCRLLCRGDVITFTLSLDAPAEGNAWVRTNIGSARITRQEIIREVEAGDPPLGRGWFDVPLKRVDDRRFEATLALTEVGHFEAKCFFLLDGADEPLWPEGPNVDINVCPWQTCCANSIYNAFVRQFGPNKAGGFHDPVRAQDIQELDRAGYHVIPPSGTFRDLIAEIDFIIGTLGCRFIQLLPVFPTPTTYGRMGRFGSPYAALSFSEVDPALARFDSKATPLDQFVELVDAVHTRHGRVLIDIAINHTGWAARLHEIHPEWLSRKEGGEIEVPGAWGVEWADLTRLDYTHRDLWTYMAEVFLKWCRRGVDGFRCDAGYMIPLSAWRYIIATVREQFPDTVFFLEGLGGKRSVTRDLLNRGNFDWAYSELFQNTDRRQIEHYLPEPISFSEQVGVMVHFAETHDNNRLASVSIPYARMRTALCALLSPQGAFGFANGVEWFATEKIMVHEANSLNWGEPVNQVDRIQRLNRLLRDHPAFSPGTELRMVQSGSGNHIALLRRHRFQ